LGAAWLERGLAVGAEGTLVRCSLAPVSGGSGEGSVLEHLGAEASETLVNGDFELSECGFGMLEAPFVDAAENIVAQACPVLVEVVPAHNASLLQSAHATLSDEVMQPSLQDYDGHPDIRHGLTERMDVAR